MSKLFSLVWGYIIEVILTALLYGLLVLVVEHGDLVDFIVHEATLFSGIACALLAIFIGLFIFQLQLMNPEFCGYLKSRNADRNIMSAVLYPCLLCLAAIPSPFLLKIKQDFLIASIVYILFIYLFVNAISLIINCVDLFMLKSRFNLIYDSLQKNADDHNTSN